MSEHAGDKMDANELILFFREDFFLSDLKAETKDEILQEMVQALVNSGKIKNQSHLLDVLKKRETLGSTGIGKEVAIPHCRSLAINELYLVVGISKKGVDFQAVDHKDVHLIFLIVAPPQDKTNEYLPLLGKIVELVRDIKLRKALMKAKDFSSFIDLIGG